MVYFLCSAWETQEPSFSILGSRLVMVSICLHYNGKLPDRSKFYEAIACLSCTRGETEVYVSCKL